MAAQRHEHRNRRQHGRRQYAGPRRQRQRGGDAERDERRGAQPTGTGSNRIAQRRGSERRTDLFPGPVTRDEHKLRQRRNHRKRQPDRDEQRSRTYTGMGEDINVHDGWAVESAGPVQDRTIEHLGASDKAILANRKLLMRSIESVRRGGALPLIGDGDAVRRLRGPITMDMVGATDTWRNEWRRHDERRRQKSAWAATSVPA